MVLFNSSKIKMPIIIDDRYYNTLDIDGFSQMMKHPSYCYKFYWLEAIVKLIAEDVHETTIDAIIDEMICNAWYSVCEFHIHLSGIKADGTVGDGLERAILKLAELSHLHSSASKVEIINTIAKYNSEIKIYKNQLTNMVPGRALSGFFTKSEKDVPWKNNRKLTEYIRHIDKTVVRLPYTFGDSSKLKKEVYFNEEWMHMIQDHTASIIGWIQFEKVKWLQKNNPEVPNLIYKLSFMDEKIRKLNRVRKLWEGIMDINDVKDVFTGHKIVIGQYDVDHFIPWSFVMNDELWNLMPMDASLNVSKSNMLPKWDPFFDAFVNNQYIMYQLIYERAELYRRFEACYKDNLHSIWACQELYRPGNSKEQFYHIFEKNVRPVYDSARRQGYKIWDYPSLK